MNKTDQLKKIFPSLITDSTPPSFDSSRYKWYVTEDHVRIGIDVDELSDSQKELLAVFLKPVQRESGITDRDTLWYEYLQGTNKEALADPPRRYRFVFFTISGSESNQESLQEAFQSLFPEHMPIFFETESEGFIIEEYFKDEDDVLSYQEIIDVLMSDFYTKIRFYVSEFSSTIEEAPDMFYWEELHSQISRKYPFANVATFKEMVPYVFLHALNINHWHYLKHHLFQDAEKENELLETIKVFLESGANATLAAKKLYMHRNSLQYRVDKFTEKTGLDVKQFHQAVTTYLALLQIEHES